MQIKFDSVECVHDLLAKVKYELTDDPTMGVYVAYVQVTRPLRAGHTEVLLGTPQAAKEPFTPFGVRMVASLLLGQHICLSDEPTKLYLDDGPFRDLKVTYAHHNWVSYNVFEDDPQKV